MRKVHGRSVWRYVIDRAPMALGESRNLHGRGRAEGKAAIRRRTNRYTLHEPLRVDAASTTAAAGTQRGRRRSKVRMRGALVPATRESARLSTARSSVHAKSTADWKRDTGVFSSRGRTTSHTAGGTKGAVSARSGVSTVRMA